MKMGRRLRCSSVTYRGYCTTYDRSRFYLRRSAACLAVAFLVLNSRLLFGEGGFICGLDFSFRADSCSFASIRGY